MPSTQLPQLDDKAVDSIAKVGEREKRNINKEKNHSQLSINIIIGTKRTARWFRGADINGAKRF